MNLPPYIYLPALASLTPLKPSSLPAFTPPPSPPSFQPLSPASQMKRVGAVATSQGDVSTQVCRTSLPSPFVWDLQTSRPSPPCPRSLPSPCLPPPKPLSPASRKIHVGAVATSQGDVPTRVCWPIAQLHPPASRPLAASPSPLHSTAQRKRRIYFQ